MVKETRPEKQALLSKGSGKGSEGRVDIQVTAGQVRACWDKHGNCMMKSQPGTGLRERMSVVALIEAASICVLVCPSEQPGLVS